MVSAGREESDPSMIGRDNAGFVAKYSAVVYSRNMCCDDSLAEWPWA